MPYFFYNSFFVPQDNTNEPKKCSLTHDFAKKYENKYINSRPRETNGPNFNVSRSFLLERRVFFPR
jgi:hypothetical protein